MKSLLFKTMLLSLFCYFFGSNLKSQTERTVVFDKDLYYTHFPKDINSTYDQKKSVVIIIPTNEKNNLVQNRIHVYVKEIQNLFFKPVPILTDKDYILPRLWILPALKISVSCQADTAL